MSMTATPATPTSVVDRRLSDLIAHHTSGCALDGPFYTDPAIYALDLEAVWSRTWIFVATEAEIREPGDYLTIDVGDSSVIIIRDDDEQVRAMRNVCRHRGSRVLTEPRGETGNIVCPYHQWTYATDGRLLHAGHQAPDFDKTCFSLRQVPLRSESGLLFICLSEQPPEDFDDVAATVAPYLAPHALTRTKVAAQIDLVEEANWKLVMENNRECYHCEAGHPELTSTFFPTYGYAVEDIPTRLLSAHARYVQAEVDLERACAQREMPFELISELGADRQSAFRVQREALDGAGESYTRDGSAASARLLGELDTPRLGRLSVHHQPNMWSHFLADHAVVFAVLPLATDRTLIRTTWLVHEDAVEGEDYDVDRLTEVWVKTNEQDAALCQRTQKGVQDPAYLPGPYAPTESDVDAFMQWYLQRLREAVDR